MSLIWKGFDKPGISLLISAVSLSFNLIFLPVLKFVKLLLHRMGIAALSVF
jgi:hypothetical protein